MERVVKIHRKIVPELVQAIEERYTILCHIRNKQPISWWILAAEIDIIEPMVLEQLEFLEEAGLIESSQLGMSITNEGNSIMNDLGNYVQAVHELSGL